MKEQVDSLKRDLEIHKEVEKELAKRSQFSQQVIKRLKNEVKELEQKSSNLRIDMNSMNTRNLQRKSVGDGGKVDDLVAFLETKLEQHEKNLKQK